MKRVKTCKELESHLYITKNNRRIKLTHIIKNTSDKDLNLTSSMSSWSRISLKYNDPEINTDDRKLSVLEPYAYAAAVNNFTLESGEVLTSSRETSLPDEARDRWNNNSRIKYVINPYEVNKKSADKDVGFAYNLNIPKFDNVPLIAEVWADLQEYDIEFEVEFMPYEIEQTNINSDNL